MISITFTKNWNNKLASDYFTTIRIWNPTKYRTGNDAQIVLNGKGICNARILDTKKLKFKNINDWIAYLDAGMNANELKGMFRKMYQNKVTIPMEEVEFAWILLQRHKL